MSILTFGMAIHDAMENEMKKDPNVYLAGEDVGFYGGDFGEDRGLFEEFGPMRALDTPISETAIVGHAVGAAALGLRPIAELMHMDFIGVAMDEILNQMSKTRYMFGGKTKTAIVIKTNSGAGVGGAAQHSQQLEGLLAHIPGIKVVMPSNPADAKGLMQSAIRDDDPVVFISHKLLFAQKGEVPDGDYFVPIGKANIVREGKDVTIISWSKMVQEATAAAEKLKAEGIDAEVIDLRTIKPMDEETVLTSIKKTGRAVVLHEAVRTNGFGGEVAATIAEKAFEYLKAPIVRVTAPDVPIPMTPVLEKEYLPNADKVVEAVKKLF